MTDDVNKQDLLALCRESFTAFCCFFEPDFQQVEDHVMRRIESLVRDIRDKRIPARNLINMPPRSSKNITMPMLYPCFSLGNSSETSCEIQTIEKIKQIDKLVQFNCISVKLAYL